MAEYFVGGGGDGAQVSSGAAGCLWQQPMQLQRQQEEAEAPGMGSRGVAVAVGIAWVQKGCTGSFLVEAGLGGPGQLARSGC